MTQSAFLVPDAQALATIRLGELIQFDGYRNLTQTQMRSPLNEAILKIGLSPLDVERFTFVGQDLENNVGWVVITTTKPYDQKALLEKLSNVSTAKHEGKTYHVGQIPGAAVKGLPAPGGGDRNPDNVRMGHTTTQVLFFAAPNLLVVTNDEASMKRGITVAVGKGATTGPLLEATKRAGGSHHVYLAFDLPPSAQEKMKNVFPLLGTQARLAAPLFHFTSCTGSIDYGTDLVVDLALKYADEARAQSAMKSAEALKTMAQLFLLPKAKKPEVAEAMNATLESLSVQQRGAELAVKLKVAREVFEASIPAKALPGG
jgi:hypothetical protein